MSEAIPFSPLPLPALEKVITPFIGLGAGLINNLPSLKLELKQAEINIKPEKYGAIMIFLLLFYFLFFTLFSVIIFLKFDPEKALPVGISVGLLFSLMVFAQLSLFPKIKVRKKARDIDRNLVFATRTILIQIKSGVSLFNAVNFVSRGNFGAVSKEFRKAVDKINTGEEEQKVLEELASNNPSDFFRRTIWQLVNGLKAGANISNILETTVDALTKEQRNQVIRYGSDLKMFSLVYMMIGVIIPALGLTFLIILASFPQTKIEEIYFWILIVFIGLMDFMYMGMVKSKRPNLLGE